MDNLEMSVDGVAKAGRGNRTLVFSLEGYCSTIELHPREPAKAAERDLAVRDDTGECRIRTCEGISHQIYSLTPLAAWVTPRVVWMRCACVSRCYHRRIARRPAAGSEHPGTDLPQGGVAPAR